MSDKLPQQNPNEEVELGLLLSLIKSAFRKFFDSIAAFFKGIYSVIILFLTHIFKSAKWYGIAIFSGLVLGYFIDHFSEKIYGAKMLVETNFDSAHQVYENLKYLNQLAGVDNDSTELSTKLEITVKEARTLKNFKIEPDIDENEKIRLFSEFKAELDSVSREELIYTDYIESLSFFSFSKHEITVTSSDKFIFQKLRDNLTKILTNNDHLTLMKKTTLQNLSGEKEFLLEQQSEMDSLLKEYLRIRIKASEKETVSGTGSGTNFYMGNAQDNKLFVDEADLLSKKRMIEKLIREINLDLAKSKEVINVIAKFPDAGYDISEWTEKKKFTLPIIFFSLTLIGFIILGLNKYLNQNR
ncbi:hypothetical protein [Winogradskyella sp.]|uniref:hypothetical protein n=1 Tax=Winogradskyella sp. TaxID=1883156 RepID=UPI0025EACB17|nr:hypothetical protein [Winogradskyella sp.]